MALENSYELSAALSQYIRNEAQGAQTFIAESDSINIKYHLSMLNELYFVSNYHLSSFSFSNKALMTRPDDLANPGMAGKRTDVSVK